MKKPKGLLYIFKPETVIGWYKKYVKKFWTFPTAKKDTGRPPVPGETIDLILKMKKENHTWGCRRIHGELKKLHIQVSPSKIAEILIRHCLDPTDSGLSWSAFLQSHLLSLFALDIKTVTTVAGIRLFIFFFISHHSRKIVHWNVTANPTKQWIEIQLRNFTYSFDDQVYLIRDNDILFNNIDFGQFNIQDVPIAFQTPNMNAVVERFIGSFKREALNHFVIINENQLRYIVKEYVHYYNNYRPHQGLGNGPIPDFESGKIVEVNSFHTSPKGKIGKKKILGGILNHYYYQSAA